MKDFAPITQIVTTPNLLVVPNDLPVKSVAELVAYAKAQAGKLTFGSAGVGTSQHLAGELFKTMAGIDLQHVPYRGIAATVPDLLSGRITMVFGNISAMQPLYREGKARALAVTSPQRWPSVPDLPTMIELGFKDFDSSAWFGLMAPAGTPQPIIDRLHQETVRILARADVRERFDMLGMAPIGNTPAEFAAVIAAETPQWAKVIRDAGIKAGSARPAEGRRGYQSRSQIGAPEREWKPSSSWSIAAQGPEALISAEQGRFRAGQKVSPFSAFGLATSPPQVVR